MQVWTAWTKTLFKGQLYLLSLKNLCGDTCPVLPTLQNWVNVKVNYKTINPNNQLYNNLITEKRQSLIHANIFLPNLFFPLWFTLLFFPPNEKSEMDLGSAIQILEVVDYSPSGRNSPSLGKNSTWQTHWAPSFLGPGLTATNIFKLLL